MVNGTNVIRATSLVTSMEEKKIPTVGWPDADYAKVRRMEESLVNRYIFLKPATTTTNEQASKFSSQYSRYTQGWVVREREKKMQVPRQ